MGAEVGFVGIMMLFMVVFIILAILLVILWVWTIVDAVRREFENTNERLVWLLLIVLLGIIPSIIYYFVVMRPDNKGVMKADKEGKKKKK